MRAAGKVAIVSVILDASVGGLFSVSSPGGEHLKIENVSICPSDILILLCKRRTAEMDFRLIVDRANHTARSIPGPSNPIRLRFERALNLGNSRPFPEIRH